MLLGLRRHHCRPHGTCLLNDDKLANPPWSWIPQQSLAPVVRIQAFLKHIWEKKKKGGGGGGDVFIEPQGLQDTVEMLETTGIPMTRSDGMKNTMTAHCTHMSSGCLARPIPLDKD